MPLVAMPSHLHTAGVVCLVGVSVCLVGVSVCLVGVSVCLVGVSDA